MQIAATGKFLLKSISLVGLYALLAKLAGVLLAGQSVAGLLWLSTTGTALAVVLLGGYRYLPAVFAGALLGYALAGSAVALALLGALRQTAMVAVGVWALKQAGRFDPTLRSLSDFLQIAALALGVGLATAVSGDLIVWLAGSPAGPIYSFTQRWLGNFLGIVVTMPLALVWRTAPRDWMTPRRGVEVALIFALSFVVGQVVFLDWLHESLGLIGRGYWLFLMITWSVLRLGPHGTLSILALFASQGLIGAHLGSGFFGKDLAETQLANYFFYTLSLAAIGITLTTHVSALQASNAALRSREAELKLLSDRLSLAQRASGSGVWDWDIASDTQIWSDAFFRLLDHDPASTRPSMAAWRQAVHPEDLAAAEAAIKRSLDKRDSFATEYRVVLASGRIRWIGAYGDVLRDDQGECRRMLGIGLDITRRKAIDEEIQRLYADLERRVEQRTAELTSANAELDSFAYAVSHDLRAPLRAMSGFSQALIEDYGDKFSGEAKTYLDQIDIASRKMAELIEGILRLSRSARGELARVAIDMTALATRQLRELERSFPERRVAWQVDPGLCATGDQRMIDAALGNLLENAWKYTGQTESPTIRVFAGMLDGVPGFCVADNGAGFDMAHAEQLFQPFRRLHRQDEFPGIGIGLATVLRIIHRHGGLIRAESRPGAGATFCFTLPSGTSKEK